MILTRSIDIKRPCCPPVVNTTTGAFDTTFTQNYEYNIKNESIRLNNPIASTKEKPKIVNENKDDLNEGLRAVPLINEANTRPIPIPAPVNPDDANPAPINLADSRI